MHPDKHNYFMTYALNLARAGIFTVSPNPMVGCVLVRDQQIIGQGFHQRAGSPHAEIHALANVDANNAIAYVTLEPCCHTGRTPPCTKALIKAGIKKVYVATYDPNPLVAGKGIDALREAGIQVEVGLCAEAAQQLNRVFFHYIQTKKPYVFAKWAMSLDGKTITHPKDSKQISSDQSRAHTHLLREQVDAILIGKKTALLDDPQLTVRGKQTPAKHPLRLILTSAGEIPLTLKMFQPVMPSRTIVITTDLISKAKQQLFTENNIELLILPADTNGKVNLETLLVALGKREISSLLVEGGMSLQEAFFKANLVNEIDVYIAPIIIGSQEIKQRIQMMQHTAIDGDFYFKGALYV